MKIECNRCQSIVRVNTQELAWHSDTLIRVEGVVCPKCGKVYIIRVTDNALRDSLYQESAIKYDLQDLIKKRNYEYRTYTNYGRVVPSYVQNRWETKINKLEKEYKAKANENAFRVKELKKWYLRKEA